MPVRCTRWPGWSDPAATGCLRPVGFAAAPVRQRRLPADDFGHHALHQGRVRPQLGKLLRMLMQCKQAAGHGIARGVVAAHDEQHQVAQVLARRHIARCRAVRQHGDQIGSEDSVFKRTISRNAAMILSSPPQFGQCCRSNSIIGQGRPGDVAAQLLKRLPVVGAAAHGCVQAEPVDISAQRLLEFLLSGHGALHWQHLQASARAEGNAIKRFAVRCRATGKT